MISLVFAFKVMIFYQIRSQTVCKVRISLVFAFKVSFYQIRLETICKVIIFLVFTFKVMNFIRLGHKLCVK